MGARVTIGLVSAALLGACFGLLAGIRWGERCGDRRIALVRRIRA